VDRLAVDRGARGELSGERVQKWMWRTNGASAGMKWKWDLATARYVVRVVI